MTKKKMMKRKILAFLGKALQAVSLKCLVKTRLQRAQGNMNREGVENLMPSQNSNPFDWKPLTDPWNLTALDSPFTTHDLPLLVLVPPFSSVLSIRRQFGHYQDWFQMHSLVLPRWDLLRQNSLSLSVWLEECSFRLWLRRARSGVILPRYYPFSDSTETFWHNPWPGSSSVWPVTILIDFSCLWLMFRRSCACGEHQSRELTDSRRWRRRRQTLWWSGLSFKHYFLDNVVIFCYWVIRLHYIVVVADPLFEDLMILDSPEPETGTAGSFFSRNWNQNFRQGVGKQRGLARCNRFYARDSGLCSVPFFLWSP